MFGARGFWWAALLSTTFTACLFPDYQATDQSGSGASGGSGGVAGGGSGGVAGDAGTTGSGGTDGTAGSSGVAGDAGGGTTASGGMTGSGGTTGNAGSGGTTGSGGTAGSCATGACPAEQCSNSADDDGDGRADCFDTDCADAAACAGRCSDAAELPCGAVRAAKSSEAPGATDRIQAPDNCVPAEHFGPEFAYRFTGEADRRVFVEVYGLSGDLDVMLVDVPSGGACNAVDACAATGSANMDLKAEVVTFSTVVGRDYYLVVDGPAAATYSITAACSAPAGCRPARPIEAGQTISASTTLGAANVTQELSTYDCNAGIRGGPEAAFLFTPTETGQYEVLLTNPSSNLDVFVLAGPNCDSKCASPSTFGALGGRQNESILFMADANVSYYVVVDGLSAGTFQLAVMKR